MNFEELAARNRAQRMEQLARLRPKVGEARAALQTLQQARTGQVEAKKAVELMSNLRHVPNFFPTPPALVKRMIAEASLFPGCTVLEPSAGKGDIARAVWDWGTRERVLGADMLSLTCVELNYTLAKHLEAIGHWTTIRGDFLERNGDLGTFDRIIMNPPFERGADAKHIKHAFEFLKPGGRLVAIGSSVTGQQLGEWKRKPHGLTWVEERNGSVEQLPPGSFATSERPTKVNTCLLTVQKGTK